MPPLTRFAPAPTGHLHLGHVVNAIYVWGLARARGGRVLLRIEDHDTERCRPAFERAILDDLDWLGFEADVFPTHAFQHGVCQSRQSDRHAVYEAAVAALRARGLVYACGCSRHDLAGMRAGADGERGYPGTCRDRHLPFDGDVGWRVRLEPGVESFDDQLCGPQRQNPAEQCGDLLIRDRRGNWTYQFAVSVDDLRQQIDLVIRGVDLLASTGRQIALARLLGRTEPATFAHHPLVMKTPHQKLSKSDRDTGVRDLREHGWTPGRVVTHAASLVGLADGTRTIDARDVASLFSA